MLEWKNLERKQQDEEQMKLQTCHKQRKTQYNQWREQQPGSTQTRYSYDRFDIMITHGSTITRRKIVS